MPALDLNGTLAGNPRVPQAPPAFFSCFRSPEATNMLCAGIQLAAEFHVPFDGRFRCRKLRTHEPAVVRRDERTPGAPSSAQLDSRLGKQEAEFSAMVARSQVWLASSTLEPFGMRPMELNR